MNLVPIAAAIPEPGSMLEAALRYAALGWKIFPCWTIEAGACACGTPSKNPGKHPIGPVAPFGQASATTDAATIRRWWGRYPKANIAVSLADSGLCAIDIDPRNDGLYSIEALEAEHGPIESDVLQFTGGGGEHRVFRKPPEGTSLPGKLGKGVDVKLNGYIIVEPSIHYSGRPYQWEASSNPLEGASASPLPDWLRDLATRRLEATAIEPAAQPADDKLLVDLVSALPSIPTDDRDTWLNVGFALHNDVGGQTGFNLWSAWSETSTKFDPRDQTRVWRSFKRKGIAGVTSATIFHLAQQHGWLNMPAPPIVTRAADPEPTPQPHDDLLHPPGIAGTVAEWIEASSRKPQPQFSVQAALAFVATVAGRRFTTPRRNWPSLYFLNIGKSGSGKEHAKWSIEKLLEACALDRLIGPSQYTSESGLLSALVRQPSHVALVDEFGKVIEASKARDSGRLAGVIKGLIETWGRADGVMRPIGFSTFGISKEQADDLANKSVRAPALFFNATATTETFYGALSSGAARDGFLNRFLIVESDIGRQPGRFAETPPIPGSILAWAKAAHTSDGLINPDLAHDMAPTARSIPFDSAADRAFAAFDRDCLAAMDRHDAEGLAEMWSRSNEIAMKLALGLAIGANSPIITGPLADWAIEYVRFYTGRTVTALGGRVADTPFEALCQQISAVIRAGGAKGRTISEISKHSRLFKGVDPNQRAKALAAIIQDGNIGLLKTPSARGKAREAYVYSETVSIIGDNPLSPAET